jgi:hypothetical protein
MGLTRLADQVTVIFSPPSLDAPTTRFLWVHPKYRALVKVTVTSKVTVKCAALNPGRIRFLLTACHFLDKI